MKQLDKKEITELLFKASQPVTINLCPENAEDISIEVEDGITLVCRLHTSAAEAPSILYFPATNDSPDSFEKRSAMFRKFGMNVFFVAYRRHDRRISSPAFSTLLQDAVNIVPFVKKVLVDKNYSDELFIMGRSVGSICAVEAIFNYGDDFKGMIIESGVCTMVSYLNALDTNVEKLGLSEDDDVDLLDKVKKIKVPTLIFHGAQDPYIPVRQAERIQSYSGARNKQFLVIPGGTHDNLAKIGGELFFQTIKQFADTICGVNTWRKRRKKQQSIEEE